MIQPDGIVAEAFDEAERVRHQQDGLAAAFEFRELVETLVGETLVADGQHFIDQEHVRIDVNRHRKPQAHVHARRVRLHGRVDEVLEFGKFNDLIEAGVDFTLGQAQHDAVDEDVLAAGDLGMKSRAEFNQGRDAPLDLHGAARRLGNAGHELQRGALPRSVSADDGEGRSLRHRKRHVVERLEGLFRLELSQNASL